MIFKTLVVLLLLWIALELFFLLAALVEAGRDK